VCSHTHVPYGVENVSNCICAGRVQQRLSAAFVQQVAATPPVQGHLNSYGPGAMLQLFC
jgi:hypothetical protein